MLFSNMEWPSNVMSLLVYIGSNFRFIWTGNVLKVIWWTACALSSNFIMNTWDVCILNTFSTCELTADWLTEMENSSAKLSELKTPRKDAKSTPKHALHRNNCSLPFPATYQQFIHWKSWLFWRKYRNDISTSWPVWDSAADESLPVQLKIDPVAETDDVMHRALDKSLV
jgi:hypothetical protein